jgi:phosphodiesterase/alkaline phosphatase D-like protein
MVQSGTFDFHAKLVNLTWNSPLNPATTSIAINYQLSSVNPTSAAHLQDENNFYAALANGTLPQVTFIKPLGPDNEHPGYASLLQGQQHVASLVQAVQNSPYWAHTAIIITYDENGGRWDHVAPPDNNGIWGDGTRVPTIVISPFAKRGFVDHTEHDTLSILATIENRFNVKPLNNLDKNASTLASSFQMVSQPVWYLGVASGDASSTDAIVWTRAVDPSNPQSVHLTAEVSTDNTFGSFLSFAGNTDANQDYTFKIDATGLQSGTRYYYRFTTDDGLSVSQVGTFETAPAANASASLHFGFTGDADGLMRPYPAADAATAPGTPSFSAQQFDNFIWLGDTIYETASGSPGNNNSPVTPSTSTASNINSTAALLAMEQAYWQKYQQQFLAVTTGTDPGLQAFFNSTGHFTLLDNHELGNKQVINGGAAPGTTPVGIGVDPTNTANDVNTTNTFVNQSAIFKTLLQAYTDYQPIRVQTVSAPGDLRSNGTQQLYFSQQWGKNAAFFNLDDRSYRDIRMKTAGGADDTGPRADNPGRTMLGATQLAWIEQSLLDAQNNGTTWKFVSVSSPIDQIGPIGGSFTINNSGDPNTTQPGFTSSEADGGKSWMGEYRAERNALLKFIADHNINHVVFLTTDDHQVRINELRYSPTSDTANQASYVRVPGAFQIVVGPIGATGPDTVTDHSIANLQALAQSFASQQAAAGIDPIGLDPNFVGLKNVSREGDPNANTNRSGFDFYSPDTFNYAVLDVDSTGQNLTVTVNGLNSYGTNTFPQPSGSNTVRQILQFTITTTPVQAQASPLPSGLSESSPPTINGTVATFTDPAGTTAFSPGNLIVSRSVYGGSASTVTVGQPLPGGGTATVNGAYPNVWQNEAQDASFGVTSPIFLDQLTTNGASVGNPLNVTAAVGNTLATSFPSKSELSLNLSADGTAVTFLGYASGVNALDVSNSNTPGHIDLTNPVGTYPVNQGTSQRAVGQIDVNGNVQVTPVNTYSGNNGRGVILGSTGDYYMVGNAGNGGNITIKGVNTTANSTTLTITGAGNSTTLLAPGQLISGGNIPAGATVVSITDATHFVISLAPLTSSAAPFNATITQDGTTLSNLSNNTGVQMIAPGAGGESTVVGQVNGTFGNTTGYQRGFAVGQINPQTGLPYGPDDKTGKDDNFRGETIFNNTLYVTKGSGGNGIDTVYQVGTAGSLPTFANAGTTPITILPGFPTGLAKNITNDTPAHALATEFHPFGIWFANATTLYVADEGDGVLADAGNPNKDPNAGLQKWTFDGTQWNLAYTLQNGLNLGTSYSVANGPNGEVYPTNLNPATDGLRNLTGKVNGDGTVTIYAITSTVSTSTDQGADPNKLVAITDNLSFTSAGQAAGESFSTLKSARYGEALRGVSFTPNPALSAYSATIDWGDGTPTTSGNITFSGGSFSVGGNHTYADEGTYTVTTTITRQGVSTQVTGSVTVADSLTVHAQPVAVPVQTIDTGTVATFTDGTASPSDYHVTIDWGDSQTTTGLVTFDSGTHVYSVVDNGDGTGNNRHQYANTGTYTVTVTVSEPDASITKMDSNSATVPISLTGPSTVVIGQQTAFTITAPGRTINTLVYLYDNGTGLGFGLLNAAHQAIITATFQSLGTHTIMAVYNNDFNPADYNVSLPVNVNVVSPSASDNFNRPDANTLGPNWAVFTNPFGALGSYAITGNQALATGTGINAAIINGLASADVSASADVTLVNTTGGHFGGVMAREDANGDAYVGLLFKSGSGATKQAILGLYLNGVLTQFAAQSVGSLSGTLRLDVLGTALKLYLNGNLVASTTDATLAAPGGIGLWDHFGGTHFDNFAASQLLPATLPFADNFNRPASSTLGDPWSVDQGGFSIDGSNQAVAAATSSLDTASIIGVLTGMVSVQTTMNGFGGGVVMDWNGITQTGYALILTNQTMLTLYKVVSGALGSPLNSWNVSGVANLTTNTLQVNVNAGTLTPVLNGTGLTPFTDPTNPFTSGSVGIASTGGTTFTGFSAS